MLAAAFFGILGIFCILGTVVCSVVRSVNARGLEDYFQGRFGMKLASLHPGVRCATGEHLLIRVLQDGMGNTSHVRYLLEHGFDPNVRSIDGTPALIVFIRASIQFNQQIFDLLVMYGADVNAMDRFGKTALHYVHNVGFAECLLKAGAVVDALNITGQSPLFTASDNSLIQLLLDYGAKRWTVDDDGNTALFYVRTPAALECLLCVKRTGDLYIDVVKYVHHCNHKGQTALFELVKHPSVFNRLFVLFRKKNIRLPLDIVDKDGRTLLFYAKDPSSARLILDSMVGDERQAFVNHRDNDGRVAMSFVESELRERGHGQDNNVDETISELQCMQNGSHVAEDSENLALNGRDSEDSSALSALINAVRADDLFTLKKCIWLGIDLNKTDLEGNTPLYYAVSGGHGECIRILCENGADCTDPVFCRMAIHSKDSDSLSILLQCGVVMLNEHLEEAVKCHSPECMEILLKGGLRPQRSIIDVMDTYCVNTDEYMAMLRMVKPLLDK